METRGDMMKRLDYDTAIHVVGYLDQAIDVAHASLVSRSWREIVVEGRLWKKVCLREYPELKHVGEVVEVKGHEEAGPSKVSMQEMVQEHHIYRLLYGELTGSPVLGMSCISTAVDASSTDNLPQESIDETLYPRSRRDQGWSYWSSKGQLHTDVPETLTYKLVTPLCVVHEIKVRPFRAEFQYGNPVYSAKLVRFRLGFENLEGKVEADSRGVDSAQYTWTYESPEYPMKQEDSLQSFKLPRPVLCMGQILQIELSGRLQTQRLDSLYYICVCHVMVLGRPVANFDFSTRGRDGGHALIYRKSRDTPNVLHSTGNRNRRSEEDRQTGASGHQAESHSYIGMHRSLLNRFFEANAVASFFLAGEQPFEIDDGDDAGEEEEEEIDEDDDEHVVDIDDDLARLWV